MTTSQKIIKNKLAVLGLAQQLGNVSKVSKVMGQKTINEYITCCL